MNIRTIIIILACCVFTSVAGQQNQSATALQEQREEWYAWLNKGYQMLLAGNIVQSVDAYRTALLFSQKYPTAMEDTELLEYLLKPLGNNYTRLGDYEQALFIQQKALQIAGALKDNDQLASAYSNLATTASSMGDIVKSLQYCKEGLMVVGDKNPVKGLLFVEQAEALYRMDEVSKAQQSIKSGIGILERYSVDKNTAYWLLMAYQQGGDVFIAQPAVALKYYQRALVLQNQLLKENGDIRLRERAKLYYRLGNLYYHLDKYALAIEWLDKCVDLLVPGKTFASIIDKDLYGENTLLDVLFTRASVYNAQNKVDEALRLYKLCFATEKRLRNEYITTKSRERSVAESRQRYETAIDAAYMAWMQTKKPEYQAIALQFIESSKAQLLLDELLLQQQYQVSHLQNDSIVKRIQFLEKALVFYQKKALDASATENLKDAALQKNIEWELADLRKKLPLQSALSVESIDKVQAVSYQFLGNQQLIRSFFTGVNAIYSIEIDKSGIKWMDKQMITPKALDSVSYFVQHFFQNGAREIMNNPKEYYLWAYALYQQLFGKHPLVQHKEYILLTDGVISMLPVEALVMQPAYTTAIQHWPYVIKQCAVSYAYSLQTLQQQYAAGSTGKGVAGLFVANHQQQHSTLEAVALEQKGISRVIPGGQWLLNEQATTAAFNQALNTSSIVHISSHAFTHKDSIGAPNIQLYNGPFYLFELKGLQQHPSMVVLSACRTGDGRLLTGEGVQSLARAFIANGTNAVVAGCWNVNDAATAELIHSFYTYLSSGETAMQALRKAKLDWLLNKEKLHANKLPYYWAAFSYLGNPSPIISNNWEKKSSFSFAKNIYFVLIIAVITIFSAVFIWYIKKKSLLK